MAIYLIQTLIIMLYGLFGNVNKNERRKKIFVIFSFGLMILLVGLRKYTVGTDLAGHYAKSYELLAQCSWRSVPAFAVYNSYEIGYTYFCKFLTLFSSNVQFFIFVTGLITYGSFAYFIYKNSEDVVLSTAIFIFSGIFYMYMTMLRQAIAVSVILIGYEVSKKYTNKWIKYIIFLLFVLFATCFHSSAIFCALFILIDNITFKKKHIWYALAGTTVAFFFYNKIYALILKVLGSGNNYERYVVGSAEGVGNINKQTIINFLLTAGAFILGYYYMVWKKQKRRKMKNDEDSTEKIKHESFLLWMGLFAAICRLLIFRMNIINRFTYYFLPFTIVLYPYAIQEINNKVNRKVFRNCVYLVYLFYFLWMTLKFAAQFYGVMPYQFFWQ